MKKRYITIKAVFHLLFAISSATVGAIIASWPLLLISMNVQKTNEIVKMPVMKVMHNYNQLLLYLVWPFINKLKMANFPTSINAAEHFSEVKVLLELAIIVFIVGLLIYWWLGKRKINLSISKPLIIVFILLPIVVLPLALTNFDSFFVAFHHLFFHNSNWLFDPATDPIIDVLTEEFFAACFAVAGIIYELYFVHLFIKNKDLLF